MISKNNINNAPAHHASYRDIKKILTVSGTIIPKEQIEVKSSIAGIIESLFVTIGEKVKRGQPLAKIKIVTGPLEYKRIVKQYEDAQNQLSNSTKIYERNKLLYDQNVISKAEFDQIETNYLLAQSEFSQAQTEMALVDGQSIKSTKISTIITATSDGTILELPIKIGGSVMARGTFSEGSTIAKIANLDSLIFKGSVLETDINSLNEGMSIKIIAGAFKEKPIEANLNLISPNGILIDGATKFDIYANIHLPLEYRNLIRAGYSATAEFIIAEKRHVIAIEEKYLQFGNDSIFVETYNNDKKLTKTIIKPGISDDIYTEVLSGIDTLTSIKMLE